VFWLDEAGRLALAGAWAPCQTQSGHIVEKNRQRFLAALGTLRRKRAKRVIYPMKPEALRVVKTQDRQMESCSVAELRRGDRSIFFGPDCETTLPDEQIELFREVTDEQGDFFV